MTKPVEPSAPRHEFEDTPEFWRNLARRVVMNARPRRIGPVYRWVAVMEATAHGSTYSQDLCRYFGIDPFEEIDR